MTTPVPSASHPGVLLIGAGIMSATPAVLLKEPDPSLKTEIYEVPRSEAQESSNAWNNAGAGHTALMAADRPSSRCRAPHLAHPRQRGL
jgi:L-2-hydroxyglutarate oxidase LhgO